MLLATSSGSDRRCKLQEGAVNPTRRVEHRRDRHGSRQLSAEARARARGARTSVAILRECNVIRPAVEQLLSASERVRSNAIRDLLGVAKGRRSRTSTSSIFADQQGQWNWTYVEPHTDQPAAGLKPFNQQGALNR